MIEFTQLSYIMMMQDLGIEAKESAVREVAKLLPLPELLASITSIKSDYVQRQQVEIYWKKWFNLFYRILISKFGRNTCARL